MARREQREGLQEVGLARTIGPCERDRLRAQIERQARIVAEVGEAQPLHPEARVVLAIARRHRQLVARRAISWKQGVSRALDQPVIGWNHLMTEKLIDFKKLEQLICVR